MYVNVGHSTQEVYVYMYEIISSNEGINFTVHELFQLKIDIVHFKFQKCCYLCQYVIKKFIHKFIHYSNLKKKVSRLKNYPLYH